MATLVVWKANGFYARGSVIAFKIAPLSKDSGSYNFMHSKQCKFCKISDGIYAQKNKQIVMDGLELRRTEISQNY